MTRSQIATAKTMTAIKGEGDTARESNTISILQKQPKHHRQEKSSIIQTDKGKSRKIKERQKTTIPPEQAGARLFSHRPDHKNSQSVKVMQNKHDPAQTKQLSRQGKIKQNQGKTMIARPSHTRPPQQYDRNKNQRKAQR